jgi:hypothetical protein
MGREIRKTGDDVVGAGVHREIITNGIERNIEV